MMQEVKNNQRILIIAEAGVNHNGSLELAKQLAQKAKWAGADIVKFQTFRSENLVSRYAGKADYQKKTTDREESQLQMLRKLELSWDEFEELSNYCQSIGIIFLSTPFDLESIEFLDKKLKMPFWKIPSGEITNLPYLIHIARTGKKVILSTGMSTMEEISEAVDVLKEYGAGQITLLHCNTEYPTPYKDVNLTAMAALKEYFGMQTGYSDHTMGIEVPIAAAALGAAVIEKHFTLDKTMEGPDHKASLEPQELKQMIEGIRHIEEAHGDGIKKPSSSEWNNRKAARKSIVAKCKIEQGEIFSEKNLTVKRPGNGISPMKWFEMIGKRAEKDYQEDEII